MITTLLLLAAMGQAVPKHCAKGEYLSIDGRCLHDRTGEAYPAGDGCNIATCLDPACHNSFSTAMTCSHPDDPAPLLSPSGSGSVTDGMGVSVVPDQKLECQKYEHIEIVNSQATDFKLGFRCTPDIHVLYEKDWQDILERLKKLEDGKR